jgi:hypothetical protein
MTSTIFYEEEYAKNLLKNGFSSFMNFDDLSVLARYFKHIGKNKLQIRKSLIEFCEKWNPDFNEILSRDKINNAIKAVDKYGIRFPMDVNVTASELEKIKSAGNYKKQKVLFVILVIAKYFKYNDTNLDKNRDKKCSDRFFANENITNILKMAKVNVSKKERINIQHELQRDGFIISIGEKSFEVLIADNNPDISIVVTNMNNIICFYPFYCENCGKEASRVGKKHNLCESCYQEKRKKDLLNHNR